MYKPNPEHETVSNSTNQLNETYPDGKIEGVIRELQNSTVKAASDAQRPERTINNRSMCEHNTFKGIASAPNKNM